MLRCPALLIHKDVDVIVEVSAWLLVIPDGSTVIGKGPIKLVQSFLFEELLPDRLCVVLQRQDLLEMAAHQCRHIYF